MVQNVFTNFLAVSEVLSDEDLYETRLENDVNGNVLYVGKAVDPGTPTDEPKWYIKKLGYDINGFLDLIQLPNEGANFTYAWDLRATYF